MIWKDSNWKLVINLSIKTILVVIGIQKTTQPNCFTHKATTNVIFSQNFTTKIINLMKNVMLPWTWSQNFYKNVAVSKTLNLIFQNFYLSKKTTAKCDFFITIVNNVRILYLTSCLTRSIKRLTNTCARTKSTQCLSGLIINLLSFHVKFTKTYL